MSKNRTYPGHPAGKPQTRGATIAGLLAKGEVAAARERAETWLRESPNDGELLHYFGVALERQGQHQEAQDALLRAAERLPANADVRNNLGIVQESLGKYVAAEQAYRDALRLRASHAEAQANLASLLVKLERPSEALPYAQSAVRLQPDNRNARVALGDALRMTGQLAEAVDALQHVLSMPKPPARAYTSLAKAFFDLRRNDEAIDVLQRARREIGEHPLVLNDLAMGLGMQKRYDEAQSLFEMAYRQMQEPISLFNILQNLSRMKRWEELFALEAEVMRYPQPNAAIPPMFAAAVSLCNWDLVDRILPHFLAWCELEAGNKITVAIQNILYLMPLEEVAPMQLKLLLERIAAKYRELFAHSRLSFDHAPARSNPDRLRVGYLSGDFRLHAVNVFMSGLFSHYDKTYFEIYCYSNLPSGEEDEITAQYRRAVDAFIDVSGMGDLELARRIHADGVHVLIDLSGYTTGSRLPSMIYCPAPVQASYLGYPFTSGIRELDYFLADPWLDGPENARYFTEQILQIEQSFITTGEHPIHPRPVPAPLSRSGHITFGSLGNCYKLGRGVVAAWSRILAAVPGARMVLNHPNYSFALARQHVLQEFERHGIAADRIRFVWERHPEGSHLYWYEDIDIALDTFPLTGGTTTFESLWMGVPIVTCVGEVYYERISYSILRNCGVHMDDLIAFDEDSYVAKAVALASDPEKVLAIREALRREMPSSILCDPARHVRFFENTLIDGWNRKFPGQPKFLPDNFTFSRLETPAAPWVATVSDPSDLYRYVVAEQGRWFAPEYGVLARLATHLDGRAVEIGSEPGFFSLELAHAGMPALALCTSTVAGRLIRAAAEYGQVAGRVEVHLESAATKLLDRAALSGVALLRLGVEANDGAAGVIERNLEFWQSNTPLVLLSVHGKTGPDLSAAARLVERGYRLYRFLPGLGCFVVYTLEQRLDTYVLYLLACPAHREDALVAAGLLVHRGVAPAQSMPEAVAGDDAQRQVDEWVIHVAGQAYDTTQGMPERLGWLQLAIEVQQELVTHLPSLTRRLTLARLLSDAGCRGEALVQMSQALAEMQQGASQITLPFLPPAAAWDGILPGEHLAEWLFASILETRCRLAAHSTYFLDRADVEVLEMLPAAGFETDYLKQALGAHAAKYNLK